MATETSLPPETRLDHVTLATDGVERLTEFYTGTLGLAVRAEDAGGVHLGAAEGEAFLTLVSPVGLRPAPAFSTGLYHLAVLLPSRADLARAFAHMVAAEAPFTGFSDHSVSEALYLNDPDGNGIEIYRDRPRDEWPRRGDEVRMAVEPLDVNALLAEAAASPTPWAGLPGGTALGHVHLRVSDLEAAGRFYHDLLGFDITARLPGALFVSAGGYHHHLGLNVWQTRGAPPPPAGSAGLAEFVVRLPRPEGLGPVRARLQSAGWPFEADGNGSLRLRDPSGNALQIAAPPPA